MSLPLPVHKTISDPLYGTIPLTEVEIKVIDTQAYQRLRRIGQLGMADRVFPSADYSRFAHSIGACHVMGLVLDVLLPQTGLSGGERRRAWQEHRLAMLLHDVGHYPMSHATEKAVKRHLAGRTAPAQGEFEIGLPQEQYLDHERVGGKVLEHDPELNGVIQEADFDPYRIGLIFAGKQESVLRNLVKSELDADRLDYLMRSTQATGLPYGNYDRDYLIQNLKFDDQQRICLKPKALRAADHFLLCRTFDYVQSIFHKTLVGLEQMLQHCVIAALGRPTPSMRFSDLDIEKAIQTGRWLAWDDSWLLDRLRALETPVNGEKPKVAEMARRLRTRRPPKCLWLFETIGPRTQNNHRQIEEFLENAVEKDETLSELTITWSKLWNVTDVSPSKRVQPGVTRDEEKGEGTDSYR